MQNSKASMYDLQSIYKRLEKNERIAEQFFEIEKSILSILKFKDFFEVLLSQIRSQFKVPFAWIAMIKDSEVSNLIHALAASELIRTNMTVIEKKDFIELLGYRRKPLLVNSDLKRYKRLLPEMGWPFIKSVAIAPILLDGKIIGSFNQAAFDHARFKPGIDTSLLERLAVKVSICLSNVTAHEKLEYLAYQDPLTGLLNRRAMENALKREFSRDHRYAGKLSVVFLDLDEFKQVNDRYGHDCGDELLKYVAQCLKNMSREPDIIARYAGDEFVVILPETKAEDALFLMTRLQTHFKANPMIINSTRIPVSISFGVASTEDPAIKSPELILKRADERLYTAKQNRGA